MKKENFIKKINEIKKANELDLSIGEDLSIALMNLVSLEEHFLFSFMKTEERKYLTFLEQTREVRKRLLAKIVKIKKGDYSETWCISKHLLATSMRLTEVGTKHLHANEIEKANELYVDAFNIYSMFWEINGFADTDTKEELNFITKDIPTRKSKMSKISGKMKKMLDCCKE